MMPHVLIVDGNPATAEALAQGVAAAGCSAARADGVHSARRQIARQRPDVLLTDWTLPDGNGTDFFNDVDCRSGIDIVLITGHASVETAVQALRLGAADYLTKPVNMRRLEALLSRLPRAADLKSEIGALRGELCRLGYLGAMLGASPAMQALYAQISRVAPTEASVLLMGESGTGKEIAAQTIHALSLRQKQIFLPVNCGAISPQLIESEIFGHEKGSFTGADRLHKGYFERASGGTLFLDEITEMPAELQVKLLRVLESGSFMRIGGQQELETDVRIIAASNRDPAEAVARGRLRLDLYHRLNVFPLRIPPLREREDDIDLLARYFLDHFNQAHGTDKRLAPEAAAVLAGYHWPGNVRELRNHIQRAFILADQVLEAPLLAPARAAAPLGRSVSIAVGSSLADAERQLIFATLELCQGVRKRAAAMLGISLKTLYNRLEEYGRANLDAEATGRLPAVGARHAASKGRQDFDSDTATA